ncbi:acyl-CoA thioesterase II [Bosea sp. (in: a-proteobacteria)]|uniref:acyl-CoA thioesterase n=1 Tax=Bosea sp. (in: a-proteobacteria) TaxID=1871050 RepID=UPI00262FB190|nr:acyl-CoA thioesterase II [Bosea sp. (in: a-proteobacteria)]MCO5090734.1 acyl-CoA thioesterase II [Bosea sp. (in: a-proteobacteria)]
MTEIEEFLASLLLTQTGSDVYEGRSPQFGWRRVFGGQLLAQSLAAAQRTIEPDRFVHSLHACFHNPGNAAFPIRYDVARTRDTRNFSSRRVVASQQDKLIATMEASFHRDEGGPSHQEAMPLDVPRPESLPDPRDFLRSQVSRSAKATRDLWEQPTAFDVRPVMLDHYVERAPRRPVQRVWMRPKSPLPPDRVRNAAILAFMSDISLLGVTTFAHGVALTDPGVQFGSISHVMWFHRPALLDDWLLYAQDSPSSQNALGLARGSLYAADGVLVATVVQEGLVRFVDASARPSA